MHFIVALRAAVTRAAPQVGEWDAAGARYTVNDERAFLRLLAVTKDQHSAAPTDPLRLCALGVL
jgi:hypothetical protein